MKKALLAMSIVWLGYLPASAQERPAWAAKPVVAEKESSGIRDVLITAKDKEPVTLNTKIRFATTLIFPEKIVREISGDLDNWKIEVAQDNIITIKPAIVGQETNLSVLTATGHTYAFWLKSIAKGMPDLQVTLLSDPDAIPPARKWVPVAEFDAVQGQLIEAQARLDALQTQLAEVAQRKLDVVAPEVVKHFDYSPVPYEKPFKVKAIYRTDKFTYIETDAAETPTVYEMKDGKPSVLDPHIEDGLITNHKIVDEGVLVLGAKRQTFKLVKGN